MRELLRIFLRGFLIVALVAANTRAIALGHRSAAVMLGGLISLTWWGNARTAASSNPAARWAYAAGAMAGTGVALWIL